MTNSRPSGNCQAATDVYNYAGKRNDKYTYNTITTTTTTTTWVEHVFVEAIAFAWTDMQSIKTNKLKLIYQNKQYETTTTTTAVAL